MKVKVIKIAINANGINAGENTHHQDQSIVSVNFNTKKTMNIKNNPLPLDFVFAILLRYIK